MRDNLQTPVPDKQAMNAALTAMFDPADVVEIRAFHKGKKRTDAGYFDGEHRHELVDAAERLNAAGAAVYVVMNQIDPQLLGRYHNRVQDYAPATATDANVNRRRWLLLDFDPARPKETSATEEQLKAAHERARTCAKHLKDAGWPDPLAGQSGNGWHLLYPLDMPNDDESRDLVKGVLAGLAERFDNGLILVDQAVFNAARITKLYGTVATKGDHTQVTPWRLSYLKSTPKRGPVVTPEQLRAQHPAKVTAQPSRAIVSTGARGDFDLPAFLSRLGIEYDHDTHEGSTRYKLVHCPFNPDHGKGEAAIFQQASGALGFKCQHNSCSDKHWQDVRALIDGPKEARRGPVVGYSKSATSEHQPDAGDVPESEYASPIVVVNLFDFVTREIAPRERILTPWLLTQSVNMLYAWRGVGKTHVALGIAYATASGGSFLKWRADRPRRVLFLDGEMPAASMQERLKGLVAGNDDDFDPEYFRLVTPDLQTGAMPDLATSDGQDAIDAILGDTELIVIDNLSSLARSGGPENDAASWLPIQPWALRQRQQGRSVLFVHHSGKGGAQRGTSKKEDILDTVLTLKRPAEYNPADGAVFEVHFEKTRDMRGKDAEPFEARLQTDESGVSAWAFSSVEDSTFDRVVTLANQGLEQKDIALELDINKSTVSRHFRKGTDSGLIHNGAIRAYS